MEGKDRQYLASDSCKNFPSKLTRSTSSFKIGANSQACFQWLSGNDMGNKANGACTMPTPGTFPDLCNLTVIDQIQEQLIQFIPLNHQHTENNFPILNYKYQQNEFEQYRT